MDAARTCQVRVAQSRLHPLHLPNQETKTCMSADGKARTVAAERILPLRRSTLRPVPTIRRLQESRTFRRVDLQGLVDVHPPNDALPTELGPNNARLSTVYALPSSAVPTALPIHRCVNNFA